MIKRDEIVQRFLAECKTSKTNQEAVDRVQVWLTEQIDTAARDAGEGAAGFIREEANHAGRAILMLVRCTEAVAKQKSSSCASAEAMGNPGIAHG